MEFRWPILYIYIHIHSLSCTVFIAMITNQSTKLFTDGKPCGPVAPGSPLTPVAPVSPVNPDAPGNPVNPTDPTAPAGPLGPVSPDAPAGPIVPSNKRRQSMYTQRRNNVKKVTKLKTCYIHKFICLQVVA